VKQGFNGGDWLGNGITSSAAAGDVHQAATLGLIDSGEEVLVSYTHYGDADLNGQVDLRDFNRFLDGFRSKRKRWLDGDFDLSGSIDLADFDLYLQGFKHQPSPAVTPQLLSAVGDFASSHGLDVDLTALPEPSAIGVLTLASGALLRRRPRLPGTHPQRPARR
jgi:hypothetical protein